MSSLLNLRGGFKRTSDKAMLIICVCSVVCFGIAILPALLGASANRATPKLGTTLALTDFAVDAPYWSTDAGFVSTIEMKNYRVDQTLSVTPVLYPLGDREIVLPTVNLSPSETRVLNINDAMRSRGGVLATQGTVEIRYRHTTEGVFGADLTVLNVAKSLVYTFRFQAAMDSRRLEGVWWFLDSKTDGFVAVQNVSSATITVAPTLFEDKKAHRLDLLMLGPKEMKLIHLRDSLGEESRAQSQGGIRLEASAPGALVAGGGLASPDIGFSAPIWMGDPVMEAMRVRAPAVGQALHALSVMVGAQSPGNMGLPAGTVMNTIATVRDSGASAIQVHPVFRYEVGNRQQVFNLPIVHLAPDETQRIDLLPYWESGQIPHEIMQGSIELNYVGRPGSLVAAVASVDQTGTFVFDSRLEIQLAAGFQGDFWSIEDSNDTMISVKNVTVSPAKCWLTLQYNGGQGIYELPPLVIQPSETRMVDIKQLQSQRTPGANGEFLPDGSLYGGLRLVEESGGRHFLMEASVFNPVTATCGVCGSGCLYPNDFFTIPGGLDVLVGLLSGQIEVSAHMCDGTTQTGWECSCSFASNDTSVATVNPDCAQQATGISPGETSLVGTGAGVPGPHCGEQTLLAFCDIQVRPTITNLSPSSVLTGTVAEVTITGRGFGTNPSVSAGSNVSVTIDSRFTTDTNIDATFKVAGNGAGGNQSVTVTNGTHTSPPVNFFLQIPTSLRRNSITDVIIVANGTIDGNPNECGAYRSVSYTLVDQAGTQIVTDQPVSETFSNYSGPPSLAPSNKPVPDSGGALQDTLGFGTPAPQCPPAFQASFTQRFNVSVGLNVYNLTTSNAISYTSDGAGHYTITVNYTQ